MFIAKGWNDVSWNNPEVISPNLEQLARQGLILHNNYVQPKNYPPHKTQISSLFCFSKHIIYNLFTKKYLKKVVNQQPIKCALWKIHFLTTHQTNKKHQYTKAQKHYWTAKSLYTIAPLLCIVYYISQYVPKKPLKIFRKDWMIFSKTICEF